MAPASLAALVPILAAPDARAGAPAARSLSWGGAGNDGARSLSAAAAPMQPGDAAAYERFRRAVGERDELAWDGLYRQYRPLVLHWVYQHPAWPGSGDDAEFWANCAFERFFVAVTPARFAAFPGLASLLRYLKLCVHSVLLDAVRAREAVAIHLLDEDDHPSEEDVADRVTAGLAGSELWAGILAEAKDEQERLAAHLCLALGMAPRAVQARHPEHFPAVADVYRVKRNLLDRLRRSASIRQFRESGCDEGGAPAGA